MMNNAILLGIVDFLLFVVGFVLAFVLCAAIIWAGLTLTGHTTGTLADLLGMAENDLIGVFTVTSLVLSLLTAWLLRVKPEVTEAADGADAPDGREVTASSLWNSICEFVSDSFTLGQLLIALAILGGMVVLAARIWMLGGNWGHIIAALIAFVAVLLIAGIFLQHVGDDWRKLGHIAIALALALLLATIGEAIWGGGLLLWFLLLSLLVLVWLSNAMRGATPLQEATPPTLGSGREATAEDVLKDTKLEL